MLKIYFFTLFLIFQSFLFKCSIATIHDEPMDIPNYSSSSTEKIRPKTPWVDPTNLEATDSEDSLPGRKETSGNVQYHTHMSGYYQGKGGFHTDLIYYAPIEKENRFLRKHDREIKSDFKKEKRHQKFTRGLLDGRYNPGTKTIHNIPPPLPNPPKSSEEAANYLYNRKKVFRTDKKGPLYLLPKDVKEKRKRRSGEPRIKPINPSEIPSQSETEMESESEFRKLMGRKDRKRKRKMMNLSDSNSDGISYRFRNRF